MYSLWHRRKVDRARPPCPDISPSRRSARRAHDPNAISQRAKELALREWALAFTSADEALQHPALPESLRVHVIDAWADPHAYVRTR